MRLDDRIAAVVAAAAEISWLAELTFENIWRWIELELGQYLSDPKPQPYGNQHCLAYPLSPILHIVSGNTPHAALQSLIRGVIVGAINWIKLPHEGIPEMDTFVGALPKQLRPEMATRLLPHWTEDAEAVVVFGSDETVREFSQRALPSQRFLAHGQKVSLGLIWGRCNPQIAEGITRDVFPFDQLGCLSPQFFYVTGDSAEFALQLSHHLEGQRPRAVAPAREGETAVALRAFREEWKFRAATESGVLLRESRGSLDWVVIHDPEPGPVTTPLHGTIFIKPMPSNAESALSPIRRFISTIGLYPINRDSVEIAIRLKAQRICQIGQMQYPPLTWHHDGWPALGSFVRFVDIEGLKDEEATLPDPPP
jgi:Acyl-CoA reductase (LuxC)